MGKLNEFNIILDSQVCYSGCNLTGRVIVDLKKPMKMRRLQLKLHGEAHCHWTETEGSGDDERTYTYTGHEDLVQMYSYLFGSPPGTGDQTFVLPNGHYIYPFTFTLPPNLPSSFESDSHVRGHIRYYLKATIDKPWKFDHDVKIPFTVNELIDPNHPSYLSMPIPRGAASKEVGCCCPSGMISMETNINRSCYCPGESIIVNCQAINQSKTDMNALKAKLVKFTEFHARSKTKTANKVISTIQTAGIPRGQNSGFVNQPVNIPVTPPSILNCSVIKVYYQLQVYIDVPCGFDLDVKLPLVVGTVPFRETNWIQPAPVAVEPTAPMIDPPCKYISDKRIILCANLRGLCNWVRYAF